MRVNKAMINHRKKNPKREALLALAEQLEKGPQKQFTFDFTQDALIANAVKRWMYEELIPHLKILIPELSNFVK